jgi:hypothetical protein
MFQKNVDIDASVPLAGCISNNLYSQKRFFPLWNYVNVLYSSVAVCSRMYRQFIFS